MHSSLWAQLKLDVVGQWPLQRWSNVNVIVGCSGGADSVALLRALQEIRSAEASSRGSLIVAHFNHRTRGEASHQDQSFVEHLSRSLGCPIVAERASSTSADEASMRAARLDFLERTGKRHGARYVAVAHTADDNVETVLHHLFRGSGPGGLCGIPAFREFGSDLVLARPMLWQRRRLIRDALRSIGQDWVEDRSNLDDRYRRNWIRNRLLPQIESAYPHASEAIVRTVRSQTSWLGVIERLADEWRDKFLCVQPNRLVIRGRGSHESPVAIFALQSAWDLQGWARGAMNAVHWEKIVSTLNAHQPERYTLPHDLQVDAVDDQVVIARASR